MDQASELRLLVAGKTAADVASRGGAKVLVVASGKGGVGKSTVALNLALALNRMGRGVVLVDADLGLANLDLMLGITPKLTLWNFIHQGIPLTDIVIKGPEGLVLLPGGSGFEDMANLSPDGTKRLLEGLESVIQASDYVVVDTAAGIAHQVTSFAAAADEVVAVVAPESTSVMDAYGLIKVTCAHHPGQRFGVVMSMAGDQGEARRHYEALSRVSGKYTTAKMRMLGHVPRDEAARRAVNMHVPLLVEFPRSIAALSFQKIAQNAVAEPAWAASEAAEGAKSRFIGRLWRSLSARN
ncbi:MAG: MinD/ParA family protein [bacterium]|jgi:flagellar biosynthesis protein FlhG